MNFKELLRPHILALKPYSSARDEYEGSEGVFLDANENPFGSATRENYNRYPDPYQRALKQKIAKIKNTSPDRVFLGNGSDEPIDLLVRMFCRPGVDKVLICPPTYGMYEVSADINEVEVVKVPLTADFQLQPSLIKAQYCPELKIIWICTPNNPTGNALKRSDIQQILDSFEGIVVIDEAYIDFSGQESFIAGLDQYPNLVVLQTFSKAWGLASLRLGMAFTSPDIIYYLNKLKPPYNINGATQQLALEALENEDKKNGFVADIIALRDQLADTLKSTPGVELIHPTDANFLLAKIQDADNVFNKLLAEKIIVRNRSRVALCEGCLRITIGTREENDIFIQGLKKVLP